MIDFIITNWIEIVGAIAGLMYLYYEYKADIKMWPIGILMSIFYTYVFIQAKFYAFACINIYYILAAVYGWIKWSKKQESDDVGIINIPENYYLRVLGATVVIFVVISYVLINFTDSNAVYGDSFVTTLSIVAMWMLAYKFVEQWLFLIVLNIVSIFLYFDQQLYATSIMYLVFAIVSVFGYINWKKLIKRDSNEKI